jgi:hypothetical protein
MGVAAGNSPVRHALIHGPYAHDPTLAIHGPDGNRVCGIVKFSGRAHTIPAFPHSIH